MGRATWLAALVLIALALTAARAAAAEDPKRPPADNPRPRSSISERFPTLDAYLAYLEKQSHIDGAWYREIRPGVFELQTGNLRLADGARRQRIFTREELEKKFGFSR
jgi:hypothetical protein